MPYHNVVVAIACSASVAWSDAQAQSDGTADAGTTAPEAVVTALTLDGDARTRAVQQALAAGGFFAGPADGDWGPASWTALKRWRMAHSDMTLSREVAFALGHLVGVAPPESGVPQVLVNGQHMVVPAAGEARPLKWDAHSNAWKPPKDFQFSGNSQGWVMLKVGTDTELLLVFEGARFSPEGQIVLGQPLGSRRLVATLVSRDGKTLGRAGCRIGEAVLLSDVVVPCGFTVTTP